jgi:endonuclease III
LTISSKSTKIDVIIDTLKDYLKENVPIVTKIAEKERDPFLVLVGTLLSLRTKDETTERAMDRLIERGRTPEEILCLSDEELQRLIYPVGFYRNKARTLKDVSRLLIDKYGGRVPDTIEELLTIKGVGRKTANLVVNEGYGKLGICVDTHVHRISNRLGLVKTRNPHETEDALRKTLPEKYWIIYNTLLVAFGQRTCKPISPLCSLCPIGKLCPGIGVLKHR